MERNRSIAFTTNDWQAVYQLFECHKRDAGWPLILRTKESMDTTISNWAMSAWLGEGQIEVGINGQSKVGFTTLMQIPHSLCREAHAMEVGTYLVPDYRGMGYNAMFKRHVHALAKNVYGATAIVYAIANTNIVATRAIGKLPFVTERIQHPGRGHSWYLFWREKREQMKEDVTLYITQL